MNSSPSCPFGTGLRSASTIATCVLAIGRPTVMRSGSVMHRQVDQIVVSVGPYMFQSSAQRGISLRARSDVIGSPPQSTFNPGAPGQPDASSNLHVVGVAC